MISICIPIFNYDVRPLVDSLAVQAAEVSEEVEIVCIDDHSDANFDAMNRGVGDVYVRLEKNVGRAAIRNRFLKYAKGEWLLFLDNDSVVNDCFLARYVAWLDDKTKVMVGGRVYDPKSDRPECRLRYRYGVKVECRSVESRRKEPYRSFMTNNFMIRREVLEKIGFDERISLYGHEDTLYGYRLEEAGVSILHIENAVMNGEVETNEEFVRKSEEAVESMVKIYGFMRGEEKFCRSVRLLRAYEDVNRWHLAGAVYGVFHLLRVPIRRLLEKGWCTSMEVFNFYKLGLFLKGVREGESLKPETKKVKK